MFRVGSHAGIQFHQEWNAELVAGLNAYFGDASPLPRTLDARRFSAVTQWFHALLKARWNVTLLPPLQREECGGNGLASTTRDGQ